MTYKLFQHVYRTPLRLETGRYERLQPDQRTCFQCTNRIKSEEHVLLACPLYEDLRQVMENNLRSEFSIYDSLSNEEKISVILGSGNTNVLRNSAKSAVIC